MIPMQAEMGAGLYAMELLRFALIIVGVDHYCHLNS